MTLLDRLKSSLQSRHVPLFFLTCFVLVFAHSLRGEFVYDDVRWIQDNAFLREPRNAAGFFSADYFEMSREMSYRPVATLSYMLDFLVSGLHPVGYRLHNLLLHLAVCVLLWRVLFDITKSRAAAWWAVFLFCFHPIQVEVVAVPSMREEMQCAVFLLLAWLAVWHGRWITAGAVYALALLSKETAMFFPFAVVAGLFLERRKKDPTLIPIKREPHRRVLALAVLAVVTAVYVWVRFVHLRSPMETSFSYVGGTLGTSLLTHATAWTRGMLCLLFPQNLTVDPWLPVQYSPWSPAMLACIPAWLLVAAGMGWGWRHNRVVAFGFAWFIAALVPVAGIIPIVNVYADRYFYIPLIGLAIAFGAWISKIDPAWYRRVIPVMVLWIGLLAAMTYQRVGVFHDNHVLWGDALGKLGKRPWPMRILDWWSPAKEPLDAVLERGGEHPADAVRLAAAYVVREDYPNATLAFEAALAKDPTNPDIRLMLGDVYARTGRAAEARGQYEQALAIHPDYAAAHNNLGVLFLEQGSNAEAKKEFERAMALQPEYADAMCNMGTVCANMGDTIAAADWWERVLILNKYHAGARWNLLRLHRRNPLKK